MVIFPCGIVTTDPAGGTFGYLFEPNDGANRQVVHTTLVSKTDSNFQVTRKKALAYHVFSYKYNNIWAREWLQIDRFFKSVDGKLTSFYLVDFSHMQPCSMSGTTTRTITKGGTIATLRTSDFTTTTGDGGNYACVWNPNSSAFIIGIVSSIAADTNITFPAATAIGALAATTTGIIVAPVYECYFAEDQLQFEPGEFNPSSDSEGGFLYTGSIGFLQKGCN